MSAPSPENMNAWGRNNYGQLGDNTKTNRSSPVSVHGIDTAIAIACGAYHSLALLADGSVRAWGNNDDGRLGDGTTTHKSTPVSVLNIDDADTISIGNGEHILALLTGGSVMAWGRNTEGQLGTGSTNNESVPNSVSISDVDAVDAGALHSLALLSGGSIRAWGENRGDNTVGALGVGDTDDRSSPVSVSGVGASAIARGEEFSACVVG